MINKYQCTYCTKTTCTTSIESPYDNKLEPEPKCIYHDGEHAEWVAVEAGVDEQKKAFTKALVSSAIRPREFGSGNYYACCHCGEFSDHKNVIIHQDPCIITEAKLYLEGLKGE